MVDFKSLKKNSGNFDKLLKEVEKINNPAGNYEKDDTDNYWKPTPDKSGNALAVIRFLPGPAVDGDDALPWVRYFDHGFQNKTTGKWYIEKSLTTFDEKDPVSEYNSQLWNSSTDDNGPERKQARDQKRRLHYVANVYVVNDPQNKAAEGKVFLFKFGKKIMDKITKMMNPDLESEPRINPTDLWNGANFKLKMTRQNVNIGGRTVSFPNYDESTFLAQGPLSEDDAEMEAIWKSEYSLAEIIDRKNFKTYAELKARLDEVNGVTGSPVRQAPAKASVVEDDDVPFTDSKPVFKKAAPAPVADEEEDEDLAMFRKLAED
jgi:gp32 DNA binding protein like